MVLHHFPKYFPSRYYFNLTCVIIAPFLAPFIHWASSCYDPNESWAASTSISLPFTTTLHTSPTSPDAPFIWYINLPCPYRSYFITTIATTLASRREDRTEDTLPPRKRLGYRSWSLIRGRRELICCWLDRLEGLLEQDYGFVELLWIGGRSGVIQDKRAHAYTCHQMETEARLSREAWRQSMDVSDLARGEGRSVISEMLKADQRRSAKMRELRIADHTRQQQLIQTLTVMLSLQGYVTILQGQVTTLQGQVIALQGQQGPIRGPAQPELPEEADRRRREEMRELRAADRTRQQQIVQTLTVMQTLQRGMLWVRTSPRAM
ncbi:hypothetical protein Tco_0524176 [Tanacetum coccineum]